MVHTTDLPLSSVEWGEKIFVGSIS